MEAINKALAVSVADAEPRGVGTLWRTLHAVHDGQAFDLTWSEFGDLVRKHSAFVGPKEAGAWFGPATCINGRKNDASVTAIHGLTLEFDNKGATPATAKDWDRLLSVLDAAGLAYCAYRSPSHLLTGVPKGRIIIPFHRSFAPAGRSWSTVYRAAAKALGAVGDLDFDLAVDDESNGFFFGTRPSNDVPEREVIVRDGRTLDIDLFVARIPSEFVEWEAKREASPPSTWDESEPFWLRDAFAAVDMLGYQTTDSTGATIFTVECPWNEQHSTDAPSPTRSVIYAPTTTRGLGQFVCRGSHCRDRDKSFDAVVMKLAQKDVGAVMAVIEKRDAAEAAERKAWDDWRDAKLAASTPPAPELSPTVEEVLMSDAFSAPQRSYTTRFKELDALTGGPTEGLLWTIVAPPGTGKTGLAIDFALDLAAQLPVLMVCTEIDAREQAARVGAHLMATTPTAIQQLRTSPKEVAKRVAGLPLYIHELDFEDPKGLETIRQRAEAIEAAKGRAPAIVVDYLQQVAQSNDDNVRMVIGRIANSLRKLAQALHVPVIAISSTARNFYSGAAKKALAAETDPLAWLSSGKESGDLEFAAAVLMFLDIDKRDGQRESHPGRIVVAKSRRGRTGFVGVKFHGPSGAFSPDAGALGEMKRVSQAEDEDLVLEALRRTPMSRSELAKDIGKNKAWVLEKVTLLKAKGRIDERTEKPAGGRQVTGVLYVTELSN